MLHEDRIFKYKFIYFYSILFTFGYVIYYGYYIGNIIFNNYSLDENLEVFNVPVIALILVTFIFLIFTLIYIFKESYKAILFFNISVVLLILGFFLGIYLKHSYTMQNFAIALILYLIFFLIPLFLVNYYKYTPVKTELEELGKPD